MSDKATIFEALAAVMADVSSIGKNSRNQQQNYNFRGIDDVQNALHGPFSKHGVVILPDVVERLSETRETKSGGVMNVVHLHVAFTFYGPAGDSIRATVWGEAQDSADKATNKAMSAALKYALLQVFMIPTQDQQDADAVTVEAAPRAKDEPADPLLMAKSRVWTAAQKLGWDRGDVAINYSKDHDDAAIGLATPDVLHAWAVELEKDLLVGAS
jgi:hypothetical protein